MGVISLRVIPNVIHNINSNAELKVFSLLQNLDLGTGWTAYHSLNVSEHAYKQWAELDFVIVGPKGIIVLEIKGGRIAYNNGIWSFTDRYGIIHKKSEGPFKQAESGMYALRDKISSVYGSDWQNRIKLGWGVIFPDITFTSSSPETPKEVICDERATKSINEFTKYIKRLLEYWGGKGKIISNLEPDDILLKNLAAYLRPNFDFSPSLNNKINVIHQEIVQLTNEQYRYLDALENQDRIICSGGAGTGKSFLAVETARRELANGNTVLFIAMHEIFVAYLKIQLEHKLLKTCTFSELSNTINDVEKCQFDVLIVDEGQDLLSLNNLDCFDKALKKGIDGGRWRWFMDENAQAGVLGDCDLDVIEMLKSTSATYMSLKYNCRNTQQIISETELTTGAYVGITEIKGEGPLVEYCQVANDEDEIDKLVKHIESLVLSGVELNDMVILSPVSRDQSIVMRLPNKWSKRLQFINTINVISPGYGSLLFSTIVDFKGLERRFVMIIDTDMLNGLDRYESLLYVGMTRSHAGLWIAIGQKFKSLLFEIQKKNMKNRIYKK